MIKLKMAQLHDSDLISGMQKLYKCTSLEGPLQWRVVTFVKTAQKEMREGQTWAKELAKQHAQLLDGEPVTDPRGNLQFKSKEDGDAYAKVFDEKMSREVEVPISKFPFRALTALKILSAEELEAMEPILEGIPDAEDSTAGKKSGLVLPPRVGAMRQ